mgnify:FL=1
MTDTNTKPSDAIQRYETDVRGEDRDPYPLDTDDEGRFVLHCDHLAALARAREEARREAEERERAESQRAVDGVRRLLEAAQREAEFWKPYRIRKEDGDEVLCISLRFSRLALKSYRGDPRELIWNALQRAPDDAIRALGRATPTPQGESRVDQKRPPSPEALVDALQDRVHTASGPLIQSKPVTPQGETKEND